jgi:CheY-like chemotaxis protein
MSLPHVLVVDDSEVIRTFQQSALAGHYRTSVACNGREALEKLRQARPAAMLLDLSMPEMSGMDVLTHVRADSALGGLPIIVVSSEDHRRDDCLRAGADQFLAKPVRALELLATVNRVIETSRRHAMLGSLTVVVVQVGALEFGLPLEAVHLVASESATAPVPAAPAHLNEVIDLHGTPVLLLDTAGRLGTQYHRPVGDRIFVVVAHEGRQLALRVDAVRDPEEIPPDRLLPPSRLGGGEAAGVAEVLRAIATSERGLLPILDPAALVAGTTVDELQRILAAGR